MLTTFLLAAALQSSSADDCAILEAITEPQVEADGSRPDLPPLVSIRGVTHGLIVEVSDQPAFYASRATFVEGSESGSWNEPLTAEQAEEIIDHVNTWRRDTSFQERMESARHRFESDRPYLEETLGAWPEGLAENFLSSVADNAHWSCEAGDFQIVSYLESSNRKDSRNMIVSFRATPPGYSRDGNWALIFTANTNYPPDRTWPDGTPVTQYASGGRGYILLRRDGDDWIVHQHANLMTFN